jgi:hypothetical protein
MPRPKGTKPRVQPVAIYFGDGDIKDERLASLDKLAHEHGLNRSQLIQRIADGQFKLTPIKRRRSTAE